MAPNPQIDFALALIKKPDSESIQKGLSDLKRKGTLKELKPVIGLTKNPDRQIVALAADTAAHLIKKNLIQYYENIDKKTKSSLAALLQKLSPNVINLIGTDLYSENENNRLRAMQVLGLMGQSAKIKQVMEEMLADKNEKVRATAISLLKSMIQHKDLTIVMRVLSDKDARVRANAIEALESINAPRIIPLLKKHRSDSNNRVRGNVIKALWRLGDKKIVDDLREMFKNNDPFFRATAAWVLGEIGGDEKSLVNILGEFALDPHQLVKENVIKAFMKISTPEAKIYLNYLFEKEEVSRVEIF